MDHAETDEPIRVLFVDDEEPIVDLAAALLDREGLSVHTETSAAAAIDYLDATPVDCVVSDYRMPGMDGIELLDAVRETFPEMPFILSTGAGSEAVASEAISADVTDYLRKDTGTDQYELLANRIENAVSQRRAEAALERQHDELTTLNRINVVIQGIIEGLVDAATREEIERTICTNLGESDLYEFAWIAERGADGEFTVTTGAGIDEGAVGTITTDGGAPAGDLDGAVRVVDGAEAWHGGTSEEGAVAAVPLSYQNLVYGVLAVSTTRAGAFSERERAGFAVLGEVAGFAINAAQNMKRLLSDTAVALSLRLTDTDAFPVALAERFECRYALDGVVPATDATVLQYVTVEGVDPERVVAFAEGFPGVEAVRLVADHESSGVFEVTTAASPVNTVIDHGGTVRGCTVEDGVAHVECEVAADADVRRVVDAVEAAYPGTELVSKRAVELPLSTDEAFRDGVEGRLTEKQRSALRASYFAGYYDWPRESTAEEVADSMGVSSPTLHSHLRKGQRKLLAALLGEG